MTVGLSQSSGTEGSSGFGVVTLASLFPILSVLLTGVLVLLTGVIEGDESVTSGTREPDGAPFQEVLQAQVSLAASQHLYSVLLRMRAR